VEENPIINLKALMQKRVALNKPQKNWAPAGTAVRRSTEPDKKTKKKQKSRKIPEDSLQLTTLPEGEMLVPMEPCLDNPVGIPSSTETKHKSTAHQCSHST
jgi:hypothetical protein